MISNFVWGSTRDQSLPESLVRRSHCKLNAAYKMVAMWIKIILTIFDYSYDIWGDTVNLSSRLDSYGSPGKIQVSSSCADLLMSPDCNIKCDIQRDTYIKGKGCMNTYYVVTNDDFRIVYDYGAESADQNSTDL